VVMADYFKESVHARVFAQIGAPGCATCHENHEVKETSDEMVGLGERSVCAACHAPTDKGAKAAGDIRAILDSLARDHGRARDILLRAENAGMEVSQAQFELKGAADALIKARAAVHTASAAAIEKEAQAGLAISAKAYARGTRALEELQFRRKGLAVSLVIIVVLIAGLVLKIRQLERRGDSRNAV